MALTRGTVPGTIVRFEKREGRHYPYVSFVTKDGQPVERLWSDHSAEDRGLETGAAALARLNGYMVQVEYDIANPQYFHLADWESPAILAAPQTSVNFSVTPKSKKSYLFPYRLFLGFLVLAIVLGTAVLMFAGTDAGAADAALEWLARLVFASGFLLLPVALLNFLQDFYAGAERVMVKEDVIYHYCCRNAKNMVAEHRYSRILHVDRVVATRQRIRVYGEIEQVVTAASRHRKTYLQQSRTSPYRNEHDEVLAYQQDDGTAPDSDKLIFRALNDPTGKKRAVKVSRLDMRKTMEHAEFLAEKLRGMRDGQSAGARRAGDSPSAV